MRFIAIFASVQKDKEGKEKKRRKNRNFGCSYLGNGLSDFLQIWNVDSPSWWATLQKIWLKSHKGSPRYKGVKITFSFFLSIYPRCDVPISWAARHTIVCLGFDLALITPSCISCYNSVALSLILLYTQLKVLSKMIIPSVHQFSNGSHERFF